MGYLERLRGYMKDHRTRKSNISTDGLENEIQYKERWISIYVIYFTMFLMSLGFSVIVTGVWPYLNKLDPSAGKEFMGYIVAANPLGQMLFSPLVGWWANRLGSIRIPLLISLTLFTFSSAIYSLLELFTHRKYWMLSSRFLVGVSSANIAACRSYLSAATRFSERTRAVSMISLAQVLGFIIGPAIQAVVVPIGAEGVWIINNTLKLDMFTAAGWINVLLSIINFVLFLPFIFKEHLIAAREAMLKFGKVKEEDTWNETKLDYVAVWTLVVAFFLIVFNFMLLETLGTPMTMDQFAWTNVEALYYMGLLMSCGAVTACVTFLGINPLCKRFPEWKVMIWGGFLFMFFGQIADIPWGGITPQMYQDDFKFNVSSNVTICNFQDSYKNNSSFGNLTLTEDVYDLSLTVENSTNFNVTNIESFKNDDCVNITQLVGCPASQKWCTYTPALKLHQFLIGYILTSLGYPVGVTLIQTIYSKILGPRPQGVWMGLIVGSGCLSRVMGPVFVSHIYTRYGTIFTFTMTSCMMAASLIWLLIVHKRLVPKEEAALNRRAEETELMEVNNFNPSNEQTKHKTTK